MEYVVELLENPADPSVIGSKAANLAELQRAGFSVPRALCVTTSAFEEWQREGLTSGLKGALLKAFLALESPVAVRSSSPAEDLMGASFAGQYLTVLGVRSEEALLSAVERCWQSAASQAAKSYRASVDVGELPIAMAVVIQELVQADVAGVMFTINPVTDRADQIVINSNFGLGESVVSGRAEPDTFVLSKATGECLETRVGTKRVVTQEVDAGVSELPLDSARQKSLSLTANQLRLLLNAARRLESHYDAPIDSEWAFVGGTLYMLQARPVTTGYPAFHAYLLDQWARDRRLADDAAAEWARGSVLSGLKVSPLYYSEMSAFFADMFVRIAALHGAPPIRQKIFTYFSGYTYTNTAFSTAADPAGSIKPESPFGPTWRSNLRIALRKPMSYAFWCNIDYYDRRWQSEWLPGIEANRPDFATASVADIRRYIELLEVQRRERSVVAGLAVGYAPNFLGLVAWLLQRWQPDAPADTLGILTSGLPGSFTHRENVELWQLTQQALARPAVSQCLLAGRFREVPQAAGGTEFLQLADAFCQKHAHRGSSDRDIYQPRWGDDRELLLKQVALLLKLGGDSDPEKAHGRAAARRVDREREVAGRLRLGLFGRMRAAVFMRILRTTQRYVMHRDNQRHTFEPYFLNLRRAYRAIGSRLQGRGLLDSQDDIFLLAKTEIYAHADGSLEDGRLAGRVRWRRNWWNTITEQEPPFRLRGSRPYEGNTDEAAADLRGAPGAPGIATGPVRKVSSLQELNRILPGEILVTYAIDPAWTPVFGTIGGVISVEGGMLAHAAVLGREYGLPVVLGVQDALGRLKDGDMVRIDGTLGLIVLTTKEL
jgi:pyruvate,water dikinase